jgi:hypothetical protein
LDEPVDFVPKTVRLTKDALAEMQAELSEIIKGGLS